MSSILGVIVLQESDMGSLYHILEEWLSQINKVTECISADRHSDDVHTGQHQRYTCNEVLLVGK